MPVRSDKPYRKAAMSAALFLVAGSLLAFPFAPAVQAADRRSDASWSLPSLLELAKNNPARKEIAQVSGRSLVMPSLKPPIRSKGKASASSKLDFRTFRRNSFPAYQHALARQKYTVILFETELCVFCRNLANSLRDKRLEKFANRIVVSITDGDHDEGARQLEVALGVVRYPTLVVLRTNKRNIHVAGRIEGEVSITKIERVFSIATRKPIAN